MSYGDEDVKSIVNFVATIIGNFKPKTDFELTTEKSVARVDKCMAVYDVDKMHLYMHTHYIANYSYTPLYHIHIHGIRTCIHKLTHKYIHRHTKTDTDTHRDTHTHTQ